MINGNQEFGDLATLKQQRVRLWLKYDDGREYHEYHRADTPVPFDVILSALRNSAIRAGNRPVESAWTLEAKR